MPARPVKDPIRPGVRTATCGCPYCGAVVTRASEVNGKRARPKAGDFTLCLYCGAFCVFRADGTLRRPVRSEEREAQRDPAFQRARDAVVSFIQDQGASRPH